MIALLVVEQIELLDGLAQLSILVKYADMFFVALYYLSLSLDVLLKLLNQAFLLLDYLMHSLKRIDSFFGCGLWHILSVTGHTMDQIFKFFS